MNMSFIAICLFQRGFKIVPESASTMAPDIDRLYFILIGIAVFFSILIFGLIFYFMIKYRRRSDAIPAPTRQSIPLEVTWIVIPVLICAFLFLSSSSLFFRYRDAPPGSVEVFVVGKQWMWTLQHPEGPREINELHIPVGVPVKLTMTSQDVIHDFFVPAFRQKMDVVPGRYTTEWFQATETGRFHFFCSQYCGTSHSAMIGWVDVMQPEDYSAWLRANATGVSAGQAGGQLFVQFGCASCHVADGSGSGPSLQGVFGKPASLRGGGSTIVDEGFVRQMIVNPALSPIAGYPEIMPTFQGQLDEEQILDLIAYIEKLGGAEDGEAR